MKSVYRIYSHGISISLMVFSFAVTAVSCNDFLDVRPKAEKLERDLFATPQGFEDAIYGVYGMMQSQSLYGMNLTWGIPEILAQNLYCGSTTGIALGKYDYTENSEVRSLFSATWSSAYETIGYANNVLKNLEEADSTLLPLYRYYKGEMLAVRGMLHFDLLRLFSPMEMTATAIPYQKTYSPVIIPFERVETVYSNIIDDLLQAEQLLADDRLTMAYPRTNTQYDKFLNHRETHLNLYAVQSLLARVYWMNGDMDKAAQYAVKVIESNAFPLSTENEIKDYVAGVLSPKETIFGLYSTTYEATAKAYFYEFQSFFSYNPFYNGASTGSAYPEPYTAMYAKNINETEQDRRLEHFVQKAGYATWLKTTDYYGIEGNKRTDADQLVKGISLIHVAELYLIAADALCDKKPDLALGFFDKEIASRGLTPYQKQGKTLTHQIIADEFRKEMFGEGQIWFNMKRLWADIKSNVENRNIAASKSVYVIPVPQDEYEYRQ